MRPTGEEALGLTSAMIRRCMAPTADDLPDPDPPLDDDIDDDVDEEYPKREFIKATMPFLDVDGAEEKCCDEASAASSPEEAMDVEACCDWEDSAPSSSSTSPSSNSSPLAFFKAKASLAVKDSSRKRRNSRPSEAPRRC